MIITETLHCPTQPQNGWCYTRLVDCLMVISKDSGILDSHEFTNPIQQLIDRGVAGAKLSTGDDSASTYARMMFFELFSPPQYFKFFV